MHGRRTCVPGRSVRRRRSRVPAELIELSLNDYTRLVLVVIPPDQDAALGTRALAEHGADPRHAALTGRVATEAGAGCSQPADSRVIGRVRADRLN